MMLPVNSIAFHPGNARTIVASLEADIALKESMRTIGLIQPILVVPDSDDTWELRAGARRLQCAKALGWSEIAAVVLEPSQFGHDEVPETAMSAAENMVRAPMHPVDQWRAIRDLRTSCAYTLETAAAALGVSRTLARRMEWLGKMPDEMLDAIGAGDLPRTEIMRTIATAPHALQLEALERNTDDGRIDWEGVAAVCRKKRIGMREAIFDTKLMAWDEDLFAEPDDDDRFSTPDIEDFLGFQRKAVEALIAKNKGRYMLATLKDQYSYNAEPPKGWIREWKVVPKRFSKDDPRKVFVCLRESGNRVGEVEMFTAYPAKSVSANDDQRASPAKSSRPPIQKATQQKLAAMKGEAVRQRLTAEHTRYMTTEAMLRALLLVFTFKNVQIGAMGSPQGVIAQLLDADGRIREDIAPNELGEAVAHVISAAIEFDAPDSFKSSGPGAEWLATEIGAEMPRTDSEDILKGINGETLAQVATANGVKATGTVSALRKRLTGALEDWRAVDFGAPGPREDTSEADEVDWGEHDAEDAP